MTDLLGAENQKNEVICSVYHDERESRNEWLYHGYLFVPLGEEIRLIDKILEERSISTWAKELHFTNLKNTRTMNDLAVRLTQAFCNYLDGYTYFYLFGVDYRNLTKDLWVDRKTRDQRIYNRFFQIGLYSALKWFFLYQKSDIKKVKIKTIYSDAKSRPTDDLFHSMPINDIRFKALIKDEPLEFIKKRVVEVDSNHEKEINNCNQSHIIQYVDLIIGGFGQALDSTSEHLGKCMVADVLSRNDLPRMLMAFREHYVSRYYKRYCLSFFPKEKISKEEILSDDVFKKRNQFYDSRYIKHLHKNQPSLFD